MYSCFPFEDINGTLLDLFHGTQNVESQIMYSVNIVHNLPKMLECIPTTKYKYFIDKLRRQRSRSEAALSETGPSFPLGASTHMLNISDDIYTKLLTEIGFRPINIYLFKRISLQGTVLHSVMYSRV